MDELSDEMRDMLLASTRYAQELHEILKLREAAKDFSGMLETLDKYQREIRAVQDLVVKAYNIATYADLRQRFNDIVLTNRQSFDSDDEFADLQPHLTDEQLQEAETLARLMDEAIQPQQKPYAYTCSDCYARRTCPVVFNRYNTDGDCLLEK